MTAVYEHVFRHALFPLYEEVVKRRGTATYLREYERNQWLDRRAIDDLQLRKLNALLDHCWKNVPFLERHWRNAGLQPGALQSAAELSRFPLLTKQLITDNFARMRATSRSGPVFSKATSGSTAEPFRYEYSAESYARRTAVMWRAYRWCGSDIGRRSAYLWGTMSAGSRLTLFKDRCYQAAFNRLTLNSSNMSDANIDEFVTRLDRFKPRVIVGFVGPLLQMSRYLIEHQRRVHRPASIIGAAEALSASARTLISKAFDAPVYDSYGCREFMSIACECAERNGLHANTDHLVVETVDACGLPVIDAPGDMCITDLHNYAMPLVRFMNGDRAAWSDRSCACGRGLPLLQSIEGRVLDMILGADGRVVSGELLTNVVMEFPQVRWFQIIQDVRDELELRIVPRAELTADHRNSLVQRMRALVGSSIRVWINEVTEIPLTKGGKRRVTVSNLDRGHARPAP